MATQLSVNLNKIALLRNARGYDYPSVVEFACKVLDTQAIGITMHPRPDQRHTTTADIYALLDLLIDHPGKELNIEGKPTLEFMKLVLDVKPHQCTLVPDDPDQITSDHGWNLKQDLDFVKEAVEKLRAAGIRTSIFMDPDPASMELVRQTGTDRIELYTQAYAQCYENKENSTIIDQYQRTALAAQALGVAVNAGHDLNQKNLSCFLNKVTDVREVSIGHALIVESLEFGFMPTLNNYLSIIATANNTAR